MRTRLPVVAACLTMFSLPGCERVVSLDLPEGPRRLVVQARLERVRGQVGSTQHIKLTTTGPYLAAQLPPGVKGAVVQVIDDSGRVSRFIEGDDGLYTATDLLVTVGRRYTLRIDFEGNRYESTEEAMAVVAIDSLYFALPGAGGVGPKTGLRATLNFRDPRSARNFYLWDQYVNGVRNVSPESTFRYRSVLDDEAINGRNVRRFQPYEGIVVPSGAAVRIRQYGLSEGVYRFFAAMSEQTGNDGSPFGVPPTNARSNIANLTRRELPALGYFQVSEVAEATARVP